MKMSLTALLLLAPTLITAGENTALLSVPHGKSSPDASLMAVQGMSHGADAMAGIESLLVEVKQHSQKWSAANQSVMISLIEELETSYFAFLSQDDTSDTTLWMTEMAKHVACHNLTLSRFGDNGDLPLLVTAVTMRKDKHKSCRKAENTFERYKNTFNASVCEDPSSTEFLVEAPSHDIMYSAITDLNSDVALYKQQNPITTALPGSCGQDQTLLESAVCLERQRKLFACQGEQLCNEIVDVNGTKVAITGRIAQRRTAKLTFLQVKCAILEQIGLYKDDGNGGKEWTYSVDGYNSTCPVVALSADDLIIAMPFNATSIHCPHTEDSYPSLGNSSQCSSWINDNFNWSSALYTLPTSCLQGCDEIVTRTTPVLPTGCTDVTPNACQFFTYHHEACASAAYKNASTGFDPEVDCCICKGGN